MQNLMTQPITTLNGKGRRATKAVKVIAGHDRFGATLQFSNWRFECKISSKDTDGALCVYDTVRTAKGGPPLHIHHDQDEWFYVRAGEFIFKVGDETFHLKAGDSLLGPRKVPHAFASLSDTSALLVAFQPAGTIEQLFLEIGQLSESRNPTLNDWQTIARAHDVDIVGPPLDVE
jgi:mannose-6-phosphate isomerase-like protein (cupin superfamily)